MKKNLLVPIVLSTAMILGSLPYSNVLAEQPEVKVTQSVEKEWNEKSNVPIFVSEKLSEKRNYKNPNDALNYLEENSSKIGIMNPKAKLKASKMESDEIGMTHIRFNQMVNNVPVEGAEIIVHYNNEREITAINGHYNEAVEEKRIKMIAEISNEEAIEVAKAAVDAPAALEYVPTAELVIYPFEGQNYLTQKVNVNFLGDAPGNWYVYVDAETGEVIDHYNALMHADEIKTQSAVGTGVLGEQYHLHVSRSKGEHQGTIFQMADYSHENLEGILTYDYQTGNLYESKSASFKSDHAKPAVSAHANSETVYEYYLHEHGRNSLDDNGMAIVSVVNYGTDYNNAFWNGRQMTYGNGDGSFMIPLSAGLDVAAHEMTHGVITNTANLVYRFQPGALNEAYADIFGALIDDENWEIGEAIMGPDAIEDGRTALRSLSDPSKFPVNAAYIPYGNGEGMYPAHMDEYYDLPRNLDNGGVHINSSIINHAAYLSAQEIGREKLGQIYYRALTTYLTANSDFSDARKAIIQSAIDLFGDESTEVDGIIIGFDGVGIYE